MWCKEEHCNSCNNQRCVQLFFYYFEKMSALKNDQILQLRQKKDVRKTNEDKLSK